MEKYKKSRGIFLRTMLVLLMVFLLSQCNTSEKIQMKEDVSKVPQFVSARGNLVEMKNGDGTIFKGKRAGDEVINYTLTEDNYTLLEDPETGIYYYAMHDDNGDLVMSSYKAKNQKTRENKEKNFLKKISKRLEFSEKQKKEKREKWTKTKGSHSLMNETKLMFGPIDDAFPTTGDRKMLVILAEFTDRDFVKSASVFDDQFNYGSSSFKAYYQENSYDLLNITTTVVGPYSIDMTMSAADSNTRDFISRCVDAANDDGVDFSEYDNDTNGVMDALYVIYAGYGEEEGAPSSTIWAHSWDLGSYIKNYDGVEIFSYACSSELRDTSGTVTKAMGIVCHEFGHNLGAPDYYDTDGSSSGGDAWTLERWDVMATGNWLDNGDTPPHHNMHTKWKFGWSNPTVINSPATLSLGNVVENNEAYRIDTTTTNEFFILENRQQVGWDSALPGTGMLILHVDGNMIDNATSNDINTDPSHQGMDIEEADDIRSWSTYPGDPFPGSANNTSFTDTTTPNSKAWSGANTEKPVTGISESSGIITFDFMGGGPTNPPVADFSGTPTTIEVGQSVSFTDLSTNTPTSWAWDFGDTGTSTSQNPSHTYNTAGTYTVELTATNAAGSDTETKTNYITVTEIVVQPPVAEFTGTPTTIEVGQSVSFTDLTTNTPTSWAWDFGDTGTSTSQNPSHTYNTSGTFTVELTATNAAGSDTETKTDYITVTEPVLEYCSLTSTDQSYEYIETVVVEDISNTSGDDGGYGDYTSIVGHLTEGDSASVTLTPAFPRGGSYTEAWTIWIDYNVDGDFADSGEQVFTQSSSSTISSSFTVQNGTGGIRTRMRIAMQYNTALTDPCGNNGTFQYGEVEDYEVEIASIVVVKPVAAFIGTPTTIEVGQSVSFTDQSTNTPTSWAWDFGDTGTSSSQNPTHTYNTAGTFTVQLTATNSAGSDDEIKTDYITVNALPVEYCPVTSTNQTYEYIEAVVVADMSNTSGNDGGYGDFYDSKTATLTAGANATITLTPAFPRGTSYTEGWTIWIDYNMDGDFTDPGEQVFTQSSSFAITSNFTVQSGTAGATTRMRITMQYNTALTDPCGSSGTFQYGEAEDYKVVIQ